MELHDLIILLMVGAVVVYVIGRGLIKAFFVAKRRHQQRLIRDLIRGEEIS
jgi:hypothetical protein